MMHMKSTTIIPAIISILFFTTLNIYSQGSEPKTLILRKDLLVELKEKYGKYKNRTDDIIISLLETSDNLLKEKPLSVVDKSVTPPGGDKRDFMSMGPYWWPDPSKKDGLPYIRRDGERNPEYYKITDQEYFTRTVNESQLLALAFYVTGKASYAEKAVQKIRVWFLNEKTKMNPNMKHAQFIPGINAGRGIGLIETREIFKVLDAVAILRISRRWSDNDDSKFKVWLADYYKWITSHQYGLDESNEKNNHGTWYDVQAVSIALFLNRIDDAKKILENAKLKRIDSQIDSVGKQPLELARTKSWNYSCMNLSAFFHLALLGEKIGIDLWNYSAPRGGSMQKAVDYLLLFVNNFNNWKYRQIEEFNSRSLEEILYLAIDKYEKNKYSDWYKKIYKNEPHYTLNTFLF